MKNFDFATATRLDLEIWDTQNKIKYIKLPTRKPRKDCLILSQTKGVRTNTNRGNINTKFATGFGIFQKNWNWFISDFSGYAKEFADNTIVNYNGCWE